MFTKIVNSKFFSNEKSNRICLFADLRDSTNIMLDSDARFSYRFIDSIVLYGFKEPVTLYELLLDNDPRFEIRKRSISAYNRAYEMYCNRDWKGAKEIFLDIYNEYGLGNGSIMANRCERLARNEPLGYWNGIWDSSKK